MEQIKKQNIEELNYEQLKWRILETFAQIELSINFAIIEFIGLVDKYNKAFMNDIILNSNVVDFWWKIKILHNIGVKLNIKINLEPFRRIASIRNYFAHCVNPYSIHVTFTDKEIVEKSGFSDEFQIMKSNWNVEKLPIGEVSKDFFENYKVVESEIEKTFQKIFDLKKNESNI